MKKLLPVLLLVAVFLSGCHIAADKSEQVHLTGGSVVIEAEGWGFDSNTVRTMMGLEPTSKPTGWLTHVKVQIAGANGTLATDTHHAFGLDGIQTPLTRQPGVNAVVRQGERESKVTAKGVTTEQEEMKGLGVTELLWWIVGSALFVAVVLGAVYYYVPVARPIISSLISKLPGLGHSEPAPEEKK